MSKAAFGVYGRDRDVPKRSAHWALVASTEALRSAGEAALFLPTFLVSQLECLSLSIGNEYLGTDMEILTDLVGKCQK